MDLNWIWAAHLTHSLLQVATAHPLQAEEPRPHPRPSHPTLYLHHLEASPHRRASHRAMVPHHNSVSATPASMPAVTPPAGPGVAVLCTYPPVLAEFMAGVLDYGACAVCRFGSVVSREPGSWSVCGRIMGRSRPGHLPGVPKEHSLMGPAAHATQGRTFGLGPALFCPAGPGPHRELVRVTYLLTVWWCDWLFSSGAGVETRAS